MASVHFYNSSHARAPHALPLQGASAQSDDLDTLAKVAGVFFAFLTLCICYALLDPLSATVVTVILLMIGAGLAGSNSSWNSSHGTHQVYHHTPIVTNAYVPPLATHTVQPIRTHYYSTSTVYTAPSTIPLTQVRPSLFSVSAPLPSFNAYPQLHPIPGGQGLTADSRRRGMAPPPFSLPPAALGTHAIPRRS